MKYIHDIGTRVRYCSGLGKRYFDLNSNFQMTVDHHQHKSILGSARVHSRVLQGTSTLPPLD